MQEVGPTSNAPGSLCIGAWKCPRSQRIAWADSEEDWALPTYSSLCDLFIAATFKNLSLPSEICGTGMGRKSVPAIIISAQASGWAWHGGVTDSFLRAVSDVFALLSFCKFVWWNIGPRSGSMRLLQKNCKHLCPTKHSNHHSHSAWKHSQIHFWPGWNLCAHALQSNPK